MAATPPASATFEPLSGPRGVADDLKKLPGVSPAIEKKLNDLGIFHYGRLPASVRRRPIMSERKWACPAASTAGSPRPRNSAPSNLITRRAWSRREIGPARDGAAGIASVLPGAPREEGIEFVVADANRIPHMANISAQMVKELRDKTGAGMMDCKAALADTQGDLEGAVDWLRKKGLAKAAKKAGRVAAEGLIGVAVARQQGRGGRGQFRNRFRRPQRSVPGPGADDRRRRARRRPRRRQDQGRQGGRVTVPNRSPTRSPPSART